MRLYIQENGLRDSSAKDTKLTLDSSNFPEATRYYVSKTGNGTDGLSWTKAFPKLQDALSTASSGDEIWVATGVYTPGTNQTDSINLVPGAALYGGFAATETVRTERDWEANLTILSGDIDGDDTNTDGVVMTTTHIVGNNSYHVVWADGASGTSINSSTVLDGFTITAGQANSVVSPLDKSGGGFYCKESNPGNTCSPSLSNVTFSGNSATDWGGAMYNDGYGGNSSPILNNIIFSGNSAYKGGAMYNNGTISPILNNVTFSGNSAYNGGAMYNDGAVGDSSPILNNVTFSGNSAYNGGAMYNNGWQGDSSPSLSNVTFSGNSAGDTGGAMYNYGIHGISDPVLRNSILWNNQDSSGTGTIIATIYNETATITLIHSLIEASGGSASWVLDPSYGDGGGNIDADPMFITPIEPSTAPTTAGNLRLKSSSPAVNAGNNNFVTVPTDLDGNERIIGCSVDMGAYETMGDYPCQIFAPLIFR